MNRKPQQLQPPLTYFSLIHVKEKGKEETQVSKEPGVDAVVISWERLFLSGVVLLLGKKIFCLYAVQWDGMSQVNHEVIGMLDGSPWVIGWWGAVFQHETGGFCRTWRLWGRLAFSIVLGLTNAVVLAWCLHMLIFCSPVTQVLPVSDLFFNAFISWCCWLWRDPIQGWHTLAQVINTEYGNVHF